MIIHLSILNISQMIQQMKTPSPVESSSSVVPPARSAPPGSGCTPGWWGRSSLLWKALQPGASAKRCLENLSGSSLYDTYRQVKTHVECVFERRPVLNVLQTTISFQLSFFFLLFGDYILKLIKGSIRKSNLVKCAAFLFSHFQSMIKTIGSSALVYVTHRLKYTLKHSSRDQDCYHSLLSPSYVLLQHSIWLKPDENALLFVSYFRT